MSEYLITRLEHAANVMIHLRTEVTEVRGSDLLESRTIANRSTGETQEIRTCALFVMIGADPCTAWRRGTVALDEKGFVRTGSALNVSGDRLRTGSTSLLSPFQTDLPGVFAVADVRSGSVKRVASAVGEGSVVVQAVHQHLATLHRPQSSS